ncbi:lateral flagellar P-ring protein (FlgI-like) [Escherichia coli]|uniref:Lateral flagellar P-ring protein (FlgI-like) n=1 Tax=Escherichia coli TaxID=562 RepID=A0A377FAE3_ECOLX|nr:lateral flagellar P-ring protein (FlgI-like) [Escherichia coli]
MNATGASGSSVTVNTPTAGLIPNGATVEREIPSDFQMGDTITLNLKRPSFKDANNIAAAINASFGGIAMAQSSTKRYRTRAHQPRRAGWRLCRNWTMCRCRRRKSAPVWCSTRAPARW